MADLAQFAPMGVLYDNLEILLDRSVGIINRLEETPVPPGEPQFFHFAARACNTRVFVENRNFFNTGGASTNRVTALTKAMGEAVERYSAAIYVRDKLRLGSARDARFRVIPPGDFTLHAPEQYDHPGFPWVPFDVTTIQRWTPVANLGDGSQTHAPAAFVWIPYVYDRAAGEAPIGQPISTGLACHQSYEKACLSSLSEVIERDAFSIFWLAMISPPQIRIETLPDDSYDIVRRFEATGDRVVILDITTDNEIPCFLSVLVSMQEERPAFVFAASCDLDPAVAVRKALEELAHTRRYSQQIKAHLPPVSGDNDWRAVTGQLEHLNLAADHANRAYFDFVFASRKRIDFDTFVSLASGDAKRDLATAVARVEATGQSVYAADLTSSDIASLGLCVTRVLVPGYHPLFMGHNIRALGGDRLYQVPQRLGHAGITAASMSNPFPHPYP
ncbi:YcaO-like family protein [Rhizobium sp. FY34]|uniref:YcaO-like family protein n=1 Tax=Rhizobium sp. FY34 TaxID=2562309 RepID=UPI0010C137CB|nr:YcaO-like family protein [Rhizobium sp. FY34]